MKEGIVRQGRDPSHGFVIAKDDGSRAFVHRSEYPGRVDVLDGDEITYDIAAHPKGPRATNVAITKRGTSTVVPPAVLAPTPTAPLPVVGKKKADDIAVSFMFGEKTGNEGLTRIPVWVNFLYDGNPVLGLKVKLFRVETIQEGPTIKTIRHEVTQPAKVATTKDKGEAEFVLYIPSDIKPPYDLVAISEKLEYPGSWPKADPVEDKPLAPALTITEPQPASSDPEPPQKVCRHIGYQNIGTDGTWTWFRFFALTSDQPDGEGVPETELLIEAVREMEVEGKGTGTSIEAKADANGFVLEKVKFTKPSKGQVACRLKANPRIETKVEVETIEPPKPETKSVASLKLKVTPSRTNAEGVTHISLYLTDAVGQKVAQAAEVAIDWDEVGQLIINGESKACAVSYLTNSNGSLSLDMQVPGNRNVRATFCLAGSSDAPQYFLLKAKRI